MNKFRLPVLLFLLVSAVSLFATDKLNRLTRGIQVTGGTTNTNGATLVTSDNSTREFKCVQFLATVSGGTTVYTNTFTTAFTDTPIVVLGTPLVMGAVYSDLGTVRPTPTTSNVIISVLSAAGKNNNIPVFVYGYTRTGVYE